MVGRRRVALSDHNEGVGTGLAFSAGLHLIVMAFALFGLPHFMSPPPEVSEPIVVELAELGDKTTPPPRQVEAPKPEEQPPAPPKVETPPEPPQAEPPKPEPPKPEPPKPPPPAPPPPPPPEPDPIPVPAPKPKPPEPPKPEPVKPPDMLKDIKPPAKKPQPPDDDDVLLKSLDKMRQTAKPTPAPQPQTPVAASNKTVNSPLSDLSSKPTTSERDYVSAQIWPHWNVDLGAKEAATLQVTVKITILPDGRVTSAVLDVDQSRYANDTFFHAAADAALRAVNVASPLKVPPSRPDLFRDNPSMTINFDPRSMR